MNEVERTVRTLMRASMSIRKDSEEADLRGDGAGDDVAWAAADLLDMVRFQVNFANFGEIGDSPNPATVDAALLLARKYLKEY